MATQLGISGIKSDSPEGFESITAATRKAYKKYDLSAVRGMAFFSMREVKALFLRTSELAEDELEDMFLSFSMKRSGWFESVTRALRLVRQEAIKKKYIIAKNQHGQLSTWRDDYQDSEFFRQQKKLARMRHPGGGCIVCSNDMEEWHHVSYERMGTDEEYLDLRPVCIPCHIGIHAGHMETKELNCGPMPAAVRNILERQFDSTAEGGRSE